jgi:hypothetical protein
MLELFAQGFALNENPVLVGIDFNSKLVNFFTVDGDLAFFDQSISSSSACNSTVGDEFIEADFGSRLWKSGCFNF